MNLKIILTAIAISLGAQSAYAHVIPAAYALPQVRAFLEKEMEQELFRVIPPHKARSYIVSQSISLGRGKYSLEEFGFSDYFGKANLTVVLANSENYTHVECSLYASVDVVPFAKQVHPILEEEVNHEQLLLKRHDVSCRLIRP